MCQARFETKKGLIQHIVHTNDDEYHSMRQFARFLTLHKLPKHKDIAPLADPCTYEDLIPIEDLQCHLCNFGAKRHNCFQNRFVSHTLAPPPTFIVPAHCGYNRARNGMGNTSGDCGQEGPEHCLQNWTSKRGTRHQVIGQRGQPNGSRERRR